MLKELILILATFLAVPAHAKDFGVQGATFEIKEQSLLEVINARLKVLESTNKFMEHQKAIQAKVKSSIELPYRFAGIKTATFYASRNYDPSIVVDEDIKDHKGNIIALKGTHINPLDYYSFGKPLIFIKGMMPLKLNGH
jgi:conjugal transfer pilus assembly protein TraW